MNGIHDAFRREGLVRPRDGRMLAGVCAGVGRRLGLTPGVSRLLFVLVLLILPGSQLLVYPILWILMPDEAAASAGPGTSAGTPPENPWGTPPR
jgi:phage shock protein C